ncbi:thiamine-triphosphatase [Rhinophrynus dorsalis]
MCWCITLRHGLYVTTYKSRRDPSLLKERDIHEIITYGHRRDCKRRTQVASRERGMGSHSQPSRPIEVERKFVPGPHVEDQLHKLGAELQKDLVFRDSYYDSPDCQLTLRDFWLRRRDDKWELKYPPEHSTRGLCGASTQYLELDCETDITHRVSELLGVPCPLNLESLGLKEFASFITSRRRFQMPTKGDCSRRVVVDLDIADYGFAVGEVEVLVETQEEVPSALHEVEEICKQLGVLSESPVPGKMSTFLQRYRPDHYRQLLEAHVL